VGAVVKDAAVRRAIVTWLTYGLLGLAFALGVLWLIRPQNSRWEPAVNTITLVAGLTGIFVERLTAAAERRSEVLHAVADELAENARVLADPRFTPAEAPRRQVYPRLVVSAADRAVTSGALDTHRDTELVRQLHRWRDTVIGLNRRLDLTELRTFTAATADEDLEAFQRALHREDSFLAEARDRLDDLTRLLGSRGITVS
jgi:hypothetical protein